MNLFYFFLAFIIIERLAELKIASSHRSKMLELGAIEYDKAGYKFIIIMHISFLSSMVLENFLSGHFNYFSIYLILLFLLTQVLRYWCIISLGIYWNTRILVIKGSGLVKKGPYRYFKHPNYFVVVLEFLFIPLIFSLYLSAIIFSITNILVILRRIRIENQALNFA